MPRLAIRNIPYSLKFSGTDRVTLSTMDTLGTDMLNGVSVAFWFKKRNDDLTGAGEVLFGSVNSVGGTWMLVEMSRSGSFTGKISWWFRSADGTKQLRKTTTSRYDDGRWHFLSATKSGTDQTSAGLTVYIDGVSVATNDTFAHTVESFGNFDNALGIGENVGTNSLGFKGWITQPYIYKRELTSTEVSNWYFNNDIPSTPFAYYLTSAGAGTTLTDGAGNYNGTLDSAGIWNAESPLQARPARSGKLHPTDTYLHYSLSLGSGDTAVLGTVSDFFEETDVSFAMVFDIKFEDTNECVFFGGAGDGTRVMYLTRNESSVNDGTIKLSLVDSAGNVRTIKWTANIPTHQWRHIIINGTATGDDGIKLYVGGVEATISSQTNDAGYAPDSSFSLAFGEVDAGNIGEFLVTKIFFYSDSLTASEITDIANLRNYPTDFTQAYDFEAPNIGIN